MSLRSDLQKRWQDVHQRILEACKIAQRSEKDVGLLAVSKGQDLEKIRILYEFGQRDFGENYFNELSSKVGALADLSDIRWHYIGKVQSNKIKKLVSWCATIHTVCTEKHALAISQTATSLGKKMPVFIEVNAGEEPNKDGLMPGDLEAFAQRLSKIEGISVQGLMAVPPATYTDEQYAGKPLPVLYEQLHIWSESVGLGKLSLGMSGDLELAVRSGTHFLRIGQALFGPRQKGNVL
jgi:PLP dependent protein